MVAAKMGPRAPCPEQFQISVRLPEALPILRASRCPATSLLLHAKKRLGYFAEDARSILQFVFTRSNICYDRQT